MPFAFGRYQKVTRTAVLKPRQAFRNKLLPPQGTSSKGGVIPAYIARTDVKEADVDPGREDRHCQLLRAECCSLVRVLLQQDTAMLQTLP